MNCFAIEYVSKKKFNSLQHLYTFRVYKKRNINRKHTQKVYLLSCVKMLEEACCNGHVGLFPSNLSPEHGKWNQISSKWKEHAIYLTDTPALKHIHLLYAF